MQSRKHSAVEQILNVGSGFIIALLVWRYYITGYLHIEVMWDKNLHVTFVMTVISLLRGYAWRRLMNWYTVYTNKRMRSKINDTNRRKRKKRMSYWNGRA